MKNIYVALVHYPIYDKFGKIITTSITNLDIHDIARTCKTYGVKNYYLVNKLQTQKEFFERIKDFWLSEIAKKYNKDRVEVFGLIEYKYFLAEVIDEITEKENCKPIVITTTSQKIDSQISFEETRNILNEKSILLVFGTGNGLAKEIHEKADYVLTSIKTRTAYNHLSVRSAVAIILDRINSFF